ncbi:MAG: efflux RND transporter periplasmic adaptor subunit [Chloroflexota bacterium]|nr:efflux RND transporter periplasmic adaptor subunit [Chloroflexota bacterium]
MMLRRYLCINVLFCLLFLITGCGGTTAATPVAPTSPAPGTTGLTYVVQRGRVAKTLEFAGRISPVEEVPLYFKAAGFVKQVLVQSGDQVKAGDLLAKLESDIEIEGPQNQVALAELNLAVAQASLAQAEEAKTYAIAQAEMSLLVAQEQVARTKALRATYTADIVGARVGLEQAEDLLARTETEYQKALDRPWEPQDVLDTYALALQQAQWGLETAQAQYDQATANNWAYQHELTMAEIAVRLADAELKQLEQSEEQVLIIQVQQAQRTLDWLKESSQIVAPVDGEVISFSLYPGQPVEPFRVVIVVADPSALEVSSGLSSDQLKELTEGQKANVALSTTPDHTWTGTIRRLPYPYGTGSTIEGPGGIDNSVRISLDEDGGEPNLGDLVNVTVVLEEKVEALWLPPDAIRTFQDSHFVIVEDHTGQRRVDVELGIEGQDQVEILKGLTEGQVIVAP